MLNNTSLVGRLTRDPDLRYTGEGTAVCNFTLAVERPFKNSAGEREADFIRITCWRKLAENVGEYMTKGRLVAIAGRIQTRNWEDDDGNSRVSVDVVANNVTFLPDGSQKKKETDDSNDDDPEVPF